VFILAGIAGLAFAAWQLDPVLGLAMASLAALVIGLWLAPEPGP
jgi:hypothetical protein